MSLVVELAVWSSNWSLNLLFTPSQAKSRGSWPSVFLWRELCTLSTTNKGIKEYEPFIPPIYLSHLFHYKGIKEFEPFIPCSFSFLRELSTWRVHLTEPDNNRGSDLVSIACFAHNNRVFYPNIQSKLLLLLTLPVGTCCCERSFSVLRHLKMWCRDTLTEERL